jgi:esterase/lipase superfamily enzyme
MKNYLDESKGDEYKELHQKLQQMPLMKPDDDRDDFKRRFNAYQKSCNVLLNRFNTINPDDEHPLTILKILIGDTETLQQVSIIDNF